MSQQEALMEKVVSLCRRRGFVFPGSEIYGGFANSWEYGPAGAEMLRNIKNVWWERFVHRRGDMVGIDGALIMHPKVWEASGHLKTFADLLAECKACHNRIRVDHVLTMAEMEGFSRRMKEMVSGDGGVATADEAAKIIYREIGEALNAKVDCPTCGKRKWTDARSFNMMMATYVGTAREEENIAYLRPETAQNMFVDFRQVLETSRKRLPFGIAQIGKAFRNEITPGNFIFRTREFEQMEIEYFIRPDDWERAFKEWRGEMQRWLEDIGADMTKVHEVEKPESDRAHYSKRSVDFEFDYPFGQKELYGIAYRTDYDLSNHEKFSGTSLKYRDPETGEELVPHVIEPTWGVNRTFLVILLSAYTEEKDRIILKLKPQLAPYKAAVFPLLANKSDLVTKAREIYDALRTRWLVAWDDRGNIGKRYYSQDEIGTPYCVTVDFQTLEDGTVTVRDRDSAAQERVAVAELEAFLSGKLAR